jgi:hypothetical protein
VADREVAKISAYAISKAIRQQKDKKFIAVTCHYDVVDGRRKESEKIQLQKSAVCSRQNSRKNGNRGKKQTPIFLLTSSLFVSATYAEHGLFP